MRDRSRGERNLLQNKKVSLRYTVSDGRRNSDASGSGGKVHVVWDVSDVDMETLLANRPAHTSERSISRRSTSSLGAFLSSGRMSGSMESVSEAELGEAVVGDGQNVMWRDGEDVEYLPQKSQHWLPAKAKCKVHKMPDGSLEVAFHVRPMASGVWRANITESAIRPALLPSDPVQILCGGAWQSGQVLSVDGGGSNMPQRFTVLLSDGSTQKVANNQLRRHFPKDTEVQVYRGLQRGWEAAVVEEEASPEGQVTVCLETGASQVLESRLVRIHRKRKELR